MRFAIAVATDAESWRVVRRAEELGVTRAWFDDTQMLSADPFVAMAAAALKTTRIRLGTGVLVSSNRIAPVAANAFASLNKLAPGRVDFGVGTGFTGEAGDGARRGQARGARRIRPHGHGTVARRDNRDRDRRPAAADPAAQPRPRANQYDGSVRALRRRRRAARPQADRAAGRRLDQC